MNRRANHYARQRPSAARAIFHRLDKLSRERELTANESAALERAMRELGMLHDPLKAIKARVSTQFGVSVGLIESDMRDYWVSHPRQVVMYLGKRVAKLGLSEMGRLLERDHSTVATGIAAVTERRANDPKLDADIRAIEAGLAG
jgi:chromosomal replication initiation ATPase DnaA